jgi:hypothetical protein
MIEDRNWWNFRSKFLLRKRSYEQTVAALGSDCMKDLAKFCRAVDSCWDADPRVHARLEGRREVWRRIQDHLNLEPEQYMALYGALRLPDGTRVSLHQVGQPTEE